MSVLYYCARYVCPHCCGRSGSCCRCAGKGYLTLQTEFTRAMAYLWMTDDCQACQRIRRGAR